jgi:hypothetical protein
LSISDSRCVLKALGAAVAGTAANARALAKSQQVVLTVISLPGCVHAQALKALRRGKVARAD